MTAPLRIAHVVPGDLWAGAESATFQLLRALSERDDVQVQVLVLNEGELASRLRGAGVETSVLSEEQHSVRALVRLSRPLLRDADLVHAHRQKANWIAWRSGRPWITTRHGRPEAFPGLRGLRSKLASAVDLQLLRGSARLAVAPSLDVANWLLRFLPARRVVVVPNGLRDPLQGDVPRPWRSRPDVVGVLARLVPVKNVALALEALVHVPDVVLEVVGEGPEESMLRERVRILGLADRVRFVGFERDPLPRLLRWKALLVTSLHEGHPMAVIEAIAAGTPVVSVPLRGVADTLAGRCGIIAPSRRPLDVSRAMLRLLEGRVGVRASDAARARFLSAFRDDRTAAAMTAAYRTALGDPSPAPARVRWLRRPTRRAG